MIRPSSGAALPPPSWPPCTGWAVPTSCSCRSPPRSNASWPWRKKRRILIAEGVLSIQAGLNPRVLEEKIRAYAGNHGPAAAKG